jgi:hypothetical protein
MATRAKSDSERLDEAHYERVIALLEPVDGSKPITKKEACNILGIAYNTTRLTTLIEKYKENKAREAAKRASLRGKPATETEIVYSIQEYINGSTIDAISKSLYRSSSFVKTILERNSVPIRAAAHDYFTPELIPDGATRDRFVVGEVVYSVRYDSTAKIEAELKCPINGWVYRLWLLSEKWQQAAYQPVEELASLEHLRKLGVRV